MICNINRISQDLMSPSPDSHPGPVARQRRQCISPKALPLVHHVHSCPQHSTRHSALAIKQHLPQQKHLSIYLAGRRRWVRTYELGFVQGFFRLRVAVTLVLALGVSDSGLYKDNFIINICKAIGNFYLNWSVSLGLQIQDNHFSTGDYYYLPV